MLGTIFAGFPIGCLLLIAALSLSALYEFFHMLGAQKIPCFKLTGMIFATVFLVADFVYLSRPGLAGFDIDLALLVAFIILVFARQMFAPVRDREPLEAMAYTLFGILYIVWLFSFLLKILFLTPATPSGATTGQFYALFAVAIAKFSDMGAYAFGSLFGKHPFAPHISPKKTWEGFFGALISSIIAAYWMRALMADQLSLIGFWDATFLGLVLGFVAVVGDLAESVLKRSVLAKDSSHILPGIGGTLDLIDSVLFTAPVMYFYLRWFVIP